MAKILFDGDSITDGFKSHNFLNDDFYSNEGNMGLGFPCILKGMLKVLTNANNIYLNNALDGSTTDSLLKRIDKSVEFDADFLVLLIGINDCCSKIHNNKEVDFTKFEKNYREILTKMYKDNSKLRVIIQTITYNQGRDSDVKIVSAVNKMNEIILKLADEFNCMVIDTNALLTKKVEETCLADWYYPDGIHFTYNTYMYLADKILPFLV